MILQQLMQEYGIKIRRFAGASAGAWSSVFMCCGLHPMDWAQTYWETGKLHEKKLLDAYKSLLQSSLSKLIPEDAHIR